MRIISGKYRGRVLSAPKTNHTRPSSSLVRGAVFNILQDRIDGAEFLDLFAGSGLMGLEALSRGALHVTFVEKDNNALDALTKNIMSLQAETESTILRGDVFFHLKNLGKKKKQFDIIYIDPPYLKGMIADCLILIEKGNLLKEEGILFYEESSKDTEEYQLPGCVLIDRRTFGNTNLTQYKKISG
ncbi:MAG TPA: 16S rRNA (guanine(966)-N(2))-methyltransferase RsmD [Chlamydiales bacterium]|nr:16S rRNA (guanine(966)-N(2))-methyltransferase RsmD [Chlamydiales bacterium]